LSEFDYGFLEKLSKNEVRNWERSDARFKSDSDDSPDVYPMIHPIENPMRRNNAEKNRT
jgi:hypothetical protein